MEKDKATLQAALRALRVGKEVVTSVKGLSPHIKVSGDLEIIEEAAEDYYNDLTGVVGGVIDYQPDEGSSIDPLKMEEEIRSIVEAPEADNNFQVREYGVSKDTAAVLTCIEELNVLYIHIREALSGIYSIYVDEEEECIELFKALQEADEQLYSILTESIRESLCGLPVVREI